MGKHLPTYLKCPMATAQELISGKWKILILWNLSEETLRFGELMRKLPGITGNTDESTAQFRRKWVGASGSIFGRHPSCGVFFNGYWPRVSASY